MQKDSIFQTIFKRDPESPDTREFLERLTAEHPYFSPAQFFLLQQMDKQSPAYSRQAARTALLFNNPYWLNFQLTEKPPAMIKAREAETKQALPVPAQPENADNDDDAPMDKEIAPMNFELKIPEQSNAAKDEALLFEPMHLVDYFASQGIKLSEDVQTGDKLGKQLKSFTEWLKTMKKVHAAEPSRQAQPGDTGTAQTDASIQSLAEKSNTEDEVLTESMAEVLAKQGKSAKAIELYQKLSLLDPSKNAYFAAKIEQLKGI